jgi:hypothetical protein
MSFTIASLTQVATPSSDSATGAAVLVKSLQTERQQGAEALDLIESAGQAGDSGGSGRLLSVYG